VKYPHRRWRRDTIIAVEADAAAGGDDVDTIVRRTSGAVVGEQVYSVLADLALHAPGHAAAENALSILREMAFDQDMPALRALTHVLAVELGEHDCIPHIEKASIAEDLVTALPIAPLLKMNVLRFVPRLGVQDPVIWGTLSDLVDRHFADLAPFHALIRRNAPICDDVLQLYLMNTYASVCTWNIARRTIIKLHDRMRGGRLLPGNSAHSDFTFGRDLILGLPAVGALKFAIGHEAWHVIEKVLAYRDGDDGEALGAATLSALAAALPTLVASLAPYGPPAQELLVSRVLANGSISAVADRRYLHLSFSDAGGPLNELSALGLAYATAAQLAPDPMQSVFVLSPRGIAHCALADWSKPIAAQPVSYQAEETVQLVSEAKDWYSALLGAGRVGWSEDEVPTLMGVLPKTPKVFPAAWPHAREDHLQCERVATEPNNIAPEHIASLITAAVRSGEPLVVDHLMKSSQQAGCGAAAEATATLGRSGYVVRNGGIAYVGPHADDLVLTLVILSAGGCSIDRSIDDSGATLLTDAAQRSAQLTARVLEAGAEVDAPDAAGLTALALAAQAGDDAALSVLLRGGADVDATSRHGQTPLMIAGSADAVNALCGAGADTDAADPTGQTPLIAAARRGNVDVLIALLGQGADADAATVTGVTPLHLAAAIDPEQRAAEAARALLGAGAPVDEQTDAGHTALMVAAAVGNAAVTQTLLDHDADVAVRGPDDCTALHLAVNGSDVLATGEYPLRFVGDWARCAQLLCAAGADANAVDRHGQTPIAIARHNNNAAVIDAFTTAGLIDEGDE
jgi:ankyrin repeat protein